MKNVCNHGTMSNISLLKLPTFIGLSVHHDYRMVRFITQYRSQGIYSSNPAIEIVEILNDSMRADRFGKINYIIKLLHQYSYLFLSCNKWTRLTYAIRITAITGTKLHLASFHLCEREMNMSVSAWLSI